MKGLLIFTSIIALFTRKKTECAEITRKEISGSNFLFSLQVENYYNVGLRVEPIPSGAINEEIYNQHDIGDIYRLDN